MKKLVEFGNYFYDTYEPTVQVIDDDHTEGHEKVASEAFDYIKDFKPETGKRFILVIAMGAAEYYGSNKNGDAFPEKDLKLNYKNFETKFDSDGKINGGALIYKHHKNKLRKGHPWFGTVRKSFWNDKMKRIELLLEVHEDKAADVIKKIDNGEVISVSMGVKIPFDSCSVCGNKAKTVKNYCMHLKYQLRKVLPDGRKVCAINGGYDYSVHKNPLNFFDISFVFRPADVQGYMLKKVASTFGEEGDVMGSAESYEKFAFLKEKLAELHKLSDITKVIQGHPTLSKDPSGNLKVIKSMIPTIEKVVSQVKPLTGSKIESLSKYPLNQVLSTLAASNIILTTPEFLSLVVTKLTGMSLSPEVFAPLANSQSEVFSELANNPDTLEKISNYDMFQSVDPNPDIENLLEDIRENRDFSDQGFIKKAGSDFVRGALGANNSQFPWGDGKGMLHTETITDPETGKKFVVNMDAIEEGNFYSRAGKIGKALGVSALLGGAYAVLNNMGAVGKAVAPIAGISSIALGLYGLKDALSKKGRKSDSGMIIGNNIKGMTKESGIFTGGVNPAIKRMLNGTTARLGVATAVPVAGTALLSSNYENRLKSGTAGTYRTPIEQKIDKGGRHAYTNPYLVGGGAVLGSHLSLNAMDALRKGVFRR